MRQNGNALFLILIAVALFAALSYAVTRSGRGSGNINKEQVAMQAAQIVTMGAALKSAIDRALVTGMSLSTLQLSSPAGSCAAPGSGLECTSGANCLFSSAGMGASIPTWSASYGNDGNAVNFCYDDPAAGSGTWWNVTGLGTSAGDMQFSIDHVSKDMCAALNRGLGITGIPQDSTNGNNAIDVTLPAGTMSFCHEWAAPNGGKYSYIQVLSAN